MFGLKKIRIVVTIETGEGYCIWYDHETSLIYARCRAMHGAIITGKIPQDILRHICPCAVMPAGMQNGSITDCKPQTWHSPKLALISSAANIT
jgi:hypothetical protein